MTTDVRDLIKALMVLAGAILIASVVSSGSFLQAGNLHNLIQQNMMISLLALAQFYVVLTGGIDLSLGAIASLSSVVTVYLQDFGLAIALGGALGAGMLVGLVNGLLVSVLRLPAFLITLGTMQIVYSLAKGVSGGGTILVGANGAEISEHLKNLYIDSFLFLPHSLLVVLFVAFGSTAFFRSSAGRSLYFLGTSEAAAYNAGIRVTFRRVQTYVIAGAIAAIAGFLFIARVGYGDPQAGGLVLILDAIAAVTVGGASLFGGTGTVAATITGVLIIGVFNNFLNMVGVPATLQPSFKGAIILFAVFAYTQNISTIRLRSKLRLLRVGKTKKETG